MHSFVRIPSILWRIPSVLCEKITITVYCLSTMLEVSLLGTPRVNILHSTMLCKWSDQVYLSINLLFYSAIGNLEARSESDSTAGSVTPSTISDAPRISNSHSFKSIVSKHPLPRSTPDLLINSLEFNRKLRKWSADKEQVGFWLMIVSYNRLNGIFFDR